MKPTLMVSLAPMIRPAALALAANAEAAAADPTKLRRVTSFMMVPRLIAWFCPSPRGVLPAGRQALNKLRLPAGKAMIHKQKESPRTRVRGLVRFDSGGFGLRVVTGLHNDCSRPAET